MEFNGKKMTAFGMIEAEWTGEVNALAAQLQEHKDDTDNPHETTLKKIGAADYVTQRGTGGNWTWEKWNSGKAVCWGAFNIGEVAVTTAWGNWYESKGYTQDFPAGLFAAVPQIVDIAVRNSDSAMFVSRYGTLTAGNIGTFTFSRPTSRTVQNVDVGLLVIGSWK